MWNTLTQMRAICAQCLESLKLCKRRKQNFQTLKTCIDLVPCPGDDNSINSHSPTAELYAVLTQANSNNNMDSLYFVACIHSSKIKKHPQGPMWELFLFYRHAKSIRAINVLHGGWAAHRPTVELTRESCRHNVQHLPSTYSDSDTFSNHTKQIGWPLLSCRRSQTKVLCACTCKEVECNSLKKIDCFAAPC